MSTNSPQFGPYRLDEMLGRGGMGEVYRAYDTQHRRTVAIKRLAPHLADDPEFQRRFRREAHNVAQLNNPHIVPIHRYGEIDGHLYIDMRFVEGGDLDGLVAASGPLPFDRGVAILEQIASALDDAHRSGLVHRDVKPSNVLLDARVADFCYLADFGITKAASGERSTSLTDTGTLMGSLAYMAPEQFEGAVTKQSDIYALACVFYELVTGHKPYEGEGLPALMHAHMMVPPPLPSSRNPAAALFDDVVATGMAKRAAQRYSSAGDLARAARSALEAHRSRDTVAPVDVPAATVEPQPRAPAPAEPVVAAPAASSVDPAPEDCSSGTARTDQFPPSALRAAAGSWPAPAARRGEPDRIGPRAPDTVSVKHAAPPPPPPGESSPPRPDRRRLLPFAAAAVIVALVAGIWAVMQGMTTTGSASGPEIETSSPTAAAAPTSAATPAPTAAPAESPQGPTIPEGVYLGHTARGATPIAVGFKDHKAAAYLCDGKSVEAWMNGTLDGTTLTLANKNGKTTISASIVGFSMSGKITRDGAEESFSADIAVDNAGLYESRRTVEGITTRIGWIVLPNGEPAVGIRTENGVSAPAPPLDPVTLAAFDGDQRIPVEKLSGTSVVVLK